MFGRPGDSMEHADIHPTRKAKHAITHFSRKMLVELLVKLFQLREELRESKEFDKESVVKKAFISLTQQKFSSDEAFLESVENVTKERAKAMEDIKNLRKINECLVTGKNIPPDLCPEQYGFDMVPPEITDREIRAVQYELYPTSIRNIRAGLERIKALRKNEGIGNVKANDKKRLAGPESYATNLLNALIEVRDDKAITDSSTGQKPFRYTEIRNLVLAETAKSNCASIWSSEFISKLDHLLPSLELVKVSDSISKILRSIKLREDVESDLASITREIGRLLSVNSDDIYTIKMSECLEKITILAASSKTLHDMMQGINAAIRHKEQSDLMFTAEKDQILTDLYSFLDIAYEAVSLVASGTLGYQPNVVWAIIQAYYFARFPDISDTEDYYRHLKRLIPEARIKIRPEDLEVILLSSLSTVAQVENFLFASSEESHTLTLTAQERVLYQGSQPFSNCCEALVYDLFRALLFGTKDGSLDIGRIKRIGLNPSKDLLDLLQPASGEPIAVHLNKFFQNQDGCIYRNIFLRGSFAKPCPSDSTGYLKWSAHLEKLFNRKLNQDDVLNFPKVPSCSFRIYKEPWIGYELGYAALDFLNLANSLLGLGLPQYFQLGHGAVTGFNILSEKLPFLTSISRPDEVGFKASFLEITLSNQKFHAVGKVRNTRAGSSQITWADIIQPHTPIVFEFHVYHMGRYLPEFTYELENVYIRTTTMLRRFYDGFLVFRMDEIDQLTDLLSWGSPVQAPPRQKLCDDLDAIGEQYGGVQEFLKMSPQVRKLLKEIKWQKTLSDQHFCILRGVYRQMDLKHKVDLLSCTISDEMLPFAYGPLLNEDFKSLSHDQEKLETLILSLTADRIAKLKVMPVLDDAGSLLDEVADLLRIHPRPDSLNNTNTDLITAYRLRCKDRT